MHDYDPGEPYDGKPPRRRSRREYRRESEIDDAWAAADEDDFYDDGAEIEDYAAGYLWEDREKHGVGHDDDDADDLGNTEAVQAAGLGPVSPSGRRAFERRHQNIPREMRIRERYDRSQAYGRSPSYRKSERNFFERFASRFSGEDDYYVDPRKRKDDPYDRPGLLGEMPFWGILILVVLGFAAFVVAILACISVALLFG